MHFARMIFAVAVIVALSGCASERMANVGESTAVAAPPADKAVVVFLRPSLLGGAIQSSVFDISDGSPQLVGIISAHKKLAYVTGPGARRFMVIGESADFMDAQLLAGNTYYARVAPRLGVWKARFSLHPVESGDHDLPGDLAATSWVENTAASAEWAKENLSDVLAKENEYLPKWLEKSSKPLLNASFTH